MSVAARREPVVEADRWAEVGTPLAMVCMSDGIWFHSGSCWVA